MNRASSFRELFWENPMTMEATRMWRQFLRSGVDDESAIIHRRINTVLIGILGFLYLWILLIIGHTNSDASEFVILAELGLLTIMIPGSLYGAIALEREKLTYDALIMTRLTPAQVVCGKLWWRLGIVAGVMGIFALPLLLTHAMAHGKPDYSLGTLLWTQVAIFSWSLFLSAYSLYASAKSKKAILALLSIVGMSLAFLVLVPSLVSLFGNTGHSPLMDAGIWLCRMNPFIAVGNADMHGSFWTYPGQDYDDRLRTVQAGLAYHADLTGWVVPVYLALSAILIRGAIKTLRGLEMPMADNRKRGR